MTNFFFYFGLTISVLLGIAFCFVLGAIIVFLVVGLWELVRDRKRLRLFQKAHARQISEIIKLSLDNLYRVGCNGSHTLEDIDKSLEKYKKKHEIE